MCVYSVDTLVLPIQEALGHKVDMSFTCFVLGVLDYVAADALKVAGNFIKNTRDRSQDNPRGGVIQERDLRVSINVDQVQLLHVKRFCKIEQFSLSIVVWIIKMKLKAIFAIHIIPLFMTQWQKYSNLTVL